MTPDIHPHWRSTDSSAAAPEPSGGADTFWPVGPETRESASATVGKPHRVRIARGRGGRGIAGVGLGILSLGVLGFVFLRGVHLIRADLLEGQHPVVETPIEGAPTSSPDPSPSPNPSPNPPPLPTPILTIGASSIVPERAEWPALLRENRFTVGSIPGPVFSPTSQLPIHAAARAYEDIARRRQASARPAARRQPETGAGLWVVGILSLCGLPLVLRKKGGGTVMA